MVALLVPAGVSMAQSVDAPSIERRLTLPEGPPTYQISPEERFLTGKDDLVILKRRELFTLSATLGPSYSSNAFLSDANKQGDIVVNGAANFRAETVIDQRYTVFADAALSIARHDDFSQLDYDAVAAGFGGSMPSGLWTYSANYRLTYVTEPGGLDDHIVTQNNIAGTISYQVAIDQESALFPFASLSRIWADPGDFSNTSLSAGASYVRRLTSDVLLSAGLQFVRRHYDDFFEDVLGETRKDFGGSGSVGLRWTPRADIVVQGSVGFGQVNSSIQTVNYREFSVSPSVTAQIKF